MSFIPSSNPAVNTIAAKAGSGLTTSTGADKTTITTDNFVAGSNITLVRNTGLNTLTIGSTALGGGIADIVPENGDVAATGCGILITKSAGPAVTATIVGAYNAGTNISLTPQGGSGNPHVNINNTMDITSAAASGITVTQASTGADAAIALNLATTGNGLAIASGTGTQKTITNTMTVTGSGPGITVTQTGGAGDNVTIANSGVTQIVAGSGISASGGGIGSVIVANTGVLSLAAASGSAISVTGSGNLTVANTLALTSGNNSGITVTQAAPGQNAAISTNLTGGNGISLSNGSGTQLVINNTGVRSLTAGSGITLSGSTGAVTISSTSGVAPKFYYCSTLVGAQTINNGNSTIVDVFMSPALRSLLASATPSSTGDLLIQTSLGFTTNATPPGGPITVQVEYNSIVPTQNYNDPNLYAQGYNSWGTTPIAIKVALSEFTGYTTLMNLGFIITNNYGATIEAAILSPAVITYVPAGTDI